MIEKCVGHKSNKDWLSFRKFLKDGALNSAKSVSKLCNLCIILESVLDTCKIAKIKPLFKKDSSYTPISLLAFLPKVFEKVFHDQTK